MTHTLADCEQWEQHSQGAGALEEVCGVPRAFRAEEKLRALHREEEHGVHWHPIEPSERDLRLWYYPGAPHPL
jgi:hypothetical protein